MVLTALLTVTRILADPTTSSDSNVANAGNTTLVLTGNAGSSAFSLQTDAAETVTAVSTNASSSITLGQGAELTVSTTLDSTLLGTLTGSGTLAYTGGGNLTIGTNLSFSGTLDFGGNSIGGTPTATLYLPGTLSVGTLHITGDTILDFGNSSATILNATKLIVDPGVHVTIRNWANLTDTVIVQDFGPGSTAWEDGGSGGDSATSDNTGTTGTNDDGSDWDGWEHEICPAPEPAAYGAVFIGFALAVFGFARRRTLPRD